MNNDRTMETSHLLKRFVPYYRKYRWILAADLCCAALTTVCELVLPLIVRYITNMGMTNLDGLAVETVLRLGFLYMVLRIVDVAANFYMTAVGHGMGARIETDMREDLFAHLQQLSYSYYDNTKVGQIMARITSDLMDVTEFAHHCPEEFFIAGIKISVSFVILMRMDVLLTLIIFAMLPLMLYFATYFSRRMRRAFKRSREQIGELNAGVEDSLLGIRVVKSFANEDMEEEKFRTQNDRFLSIKRQAYRYMAGFDSSVRFFDGLMYIAVVIVGALFMIDRRIDASELVAFLLYVTMLLASIRRIVQFMEQFQRGLTGIERFIEIMDAPVEIDDADHAFELPPVQGEIRFDDVSFRYSDNNHNVLSDIDLTVKAGEHVALVGPSGSGKTTLCNLIPRFYDVTSGRICIDGHDIKDVTIQSLRSQIGIVQQDVYLFSGSVYENIQYGNPDATKEEVVRAAVMADADEFIRDLSHGYDTYVGERGAKLSGGQKQRISIARVFLKNPPILILDEATSALDTESEMQVQRSLERLAKGRTTFTIAHRLTTIRNASIILVLTERGIEEKGTHEELLALGGVYSDLYQMYQG